MVYNRNLLPAKRSGPAGAADGAPHPDDGPASYLNFRLDILSSEAMKAADEVYRRECGLDVRHLRILRLVGHHPGITFSRLAEETRLERALTSRIVTTLTGRGLVAREASESDARQFHLRLTARGEAVRKHAAALAERLEELLLTPLTAEERTTLVSCLDKLTAWVRQGGGLETLSAPRSRRKAAS